MAIFIRCRLNWTLHHWNVTDRSNISRLGLFKVTRNNFNILLTDSSALFGLMTAPKIAISYICPIEHILFFFVTNRALTHLEMLLLFECDVRNDTDAKPSPLDAISASRAPFLARYSFFGEAICIDANCSNQQMRR